MIRTDKQAHAIAEQVDYVKSVIDVLMSAMQGDSPPGKDAIEDTIFAIRLLLTSK
jgi:hypothetical protein